MKFMDEIRMKMVDEFETYFVADSMSLEVFKLSRASRSKICKDVDYDLPDRDFCTSQNLHFYGCKLHADCSVEGFFQGFDLSAASIHDIHYLKDVKAQLSDCIMLADKGCLSQEIQLDLFNHVNIQLETPKRIDTLFSQLYDQFMIRRNYAKTFIG